MTESSFFCINCAGTVKFTYQPDKVGTVHENIEVNEAECSDCSKEYRVICDKEGHILEVQTEVDKDRESS